MSAIDNKQLIQAVFLELSKGNDAPFIDALADDIQWTWMGTVSWANTFKGKESVVNELWNPVKSFLAEPFKAVVDRIIADGDDVAVEYRGERKLLDGRSYNNKYCWVCHVAEGKIRELHEYMDTELVTATFGTDPQ